MNIQREQCKKSSRPSTTRKGNRTDNFPAGGDGLLDQFLTLRQRDVPTKHIFANGAMFTATNPVWMDNPPTLYFHSDHLGSLQLATNDGQELVRREEYFPERGAMGR